MTYSLKIECSKHIDGDLADGFTELGSPYYATLWRKVKGSISDGNFCYRVRLPFFSGRFNCRFNLYKLHGSIDQYAPRAKGTQIFKDKYGIDPNCFYQEVEENSDLRYEHVPIIHHGLHFLSGYETKRCNYQLPYYQVMLECFKSNLQRSNTLIVIGYGFKDDGINDLLLEHFLNSNKKKLLIVDVAMPDLPCDKLKSSCDICFFGGGVEDLNVCTLECNVAR